MICITWQSAFGCLIYLAINVALWTRWRDAAPGESKGEKK